MKAPDGMCRVIFVNVTNDFTAARCAAHVACHATASHQVWLSIDMIIIAMTPEMYLNVAEAVADTAAYKIV